MGIQKFKKKHLVGSGWWGPVKVDVNEELKFLGKFKKKMVGGRGSCRGGGDGGGGGGQSGCVRCIEVFVKIPIKICWVWSGGSGGLVGGGSWWM